MRIGASAVEGSDDPRIVCPSTRGFAARSERGACGRRPGCGGARNSQNGAERLYATSAITFPSPSARSSTVSSPAWPVARTGRPGGWGFARNRTYPRHLSRRSRGMTRATLPRSGTMIILFALAIILPVVRGQPDDEWGQARAVRQDGGGGATYARTTCRARRRRGGRERAGWSCGEV